MHALLRAQYPIQNKKIQKQHLERPALNLKHVFAARSMMVRTIPFCYRFTVLYEKKSNQFKHRYTVTKKQYF